MRDLIRNLNVVSELVEKEEPLGGDAKEFIQVTVMDAASKLKNQESENNTQKDKCV